MTIYFQTATKKKSFFSTTISWENSAKNPLDQLSDINQHNKEVKEKVDSAIRDFDYVETTHFDQPSSLREGRFSPYHGIFDHPSIEEQDSEVRKNLAKEPEAKKRAEVVFELMKDYKKIDFRSFDSETQIGVASFYGVGNRTQQEDRAFQQRLKGNSEILSDHDYENALENTVDQFQKSLNKMKKVGSTLCMGILDGEKMHIASLGDSLAYMLVEDEKGNVSCQLLNTKLHNANNPEEMNRLKTKGLDKNIEFDRLFCPAKPGMLQRCLAMTGSLGDEEYVPNGLTHTPYVFHVKIPKNAKKVRFFFASDGLTERNAVTLENMTQIYKSNIKKPIQEYLSLLALHAMSEGRKHPKSTDNITVTGFDYDPKSKQMLTLGILDGHSGDCVAQLGAIKIPDILQAELAQQLSQYSELNQERCEAIKTQGLFANNTRQLQPETNRQNEVKNESYLLMR